MHLVSSCRFYGFAWVVGTGLGWDLDPNFHCGMGWVGSKKLDPRTTVLYDPPGTCADGWMIICNILFLHFHSHASHYCLHSVVLCVVFDGVQLQAAL